MARLITTGFELNDVANSTVANHPDGFSKFGSPVAITSPVRSGTYALKTGLSGATGSSALFAVAGVSGVAYFGRAYIYLTGLPDTSAVRILSFHQTSGGTTGYGVYLQPSGALRFADPGFVASGSDSAALSLNTWYRIELELLIDTVTSANNVAEARLDGVTIGTPVTGAGVGSTLATTFRVGYLAIVGSANVTAFDIDVDDVGLNDSTGAAQTSWPGSEKVVLLKPASLNLNGGSWTDDAAATTSAALAGAVDNTPPNGIADTTAGGGNHQDRNAGANTSLDLNLATYSAAGIGAGDTINVAQPICSTAAPVVTGAKTGSIGITTNPTIANIAFVNGATAAANFWSGVAAGTYPTGWKWEKGTLTYGPSVTVASAPVARVTITGGTTSRIAMVDAIGMYVGYTPAVTVLPPKTVTVISQAVNRAACW